MTDQYKTPYLETLSQEQEWGVGGIAKLVGEVLALDEGCRGSVNGRERGKER